MGQNHRTHLIKDTQGNDLPSSQDSLRHWPEHFHDLLNHPYPPEDPDDPPSQATNTKNRPETQNDPVTVVEVCAALKLLNNGKATGILSSTPEQLKCGGHSLDEWLVHIINHAWMQGKVTDEWCKGINLPLWKHKSNCPDCGNYRDITLLSILDKLLTNILLI